MNNSMSKKLSRQFSRKKIVLAMLSILILGLSLPFASALLTDGLKAYWNFDETSGTNIEDLATSINNGTIKTSVQLGKNGILGTAVQFNGTNIANMTVEDDVSLNFTHTNFSISFWINATVDVKNNILFDKSSGNSKLMRYLWNDTAAVDDHRFQFDNEADTDFVVNSNNDVSLGVFQYIVVVYNSENLTIYLDGAFIDSTVYTTPLGSNSETIKFQCQSNPCNNGYVLDELGIWNRSLSQSEITELYNGGNGLNFLTDEMAITLNDPSNNTAFGDTFKIFNASVIPGTSPSIINITNATLSVWFKNGTLFNETFATLTGNVTNETNFNLTGFIVDEYKWNVLGCGINSSGATFCDINSNNFTFGYGYTFNSEQHNSSVIEFQNNFFTLNVTLANNLISSDAFLVYNNTRNLATKIDFGVETIYTFEVSPPTISAQTNVTWRWELNLASSTNQAELYNVTSGNQSIDTLGIDDCTVNDNLLLNYTIKDEETTNVLVPPVPNFTIEIESLVLTNSGGEAQTFSLNYTVNPAQVCVSNGTIESGLRLDVLVRYTANDYAVEFHNIQNATLSAANFPQNIDLFPLKTVDSQEFLVTFKDSSLNPVSGALITITRKYVSEGIFRTVEAPLTDSAGHALVHLVLGDIIYTIQVSKNGELLAVFDNRIPFCEDVTTGKCELNLNTFVSGTQVQDLQTFNQLTWGFFLDRDNRRISTIFNVLGGATAIVRINGTLFDNRGNTSVCNDQLTSSAGTLICNIPMSFGNSTFKLDLFKDDVYITTELFNFEQNVSDIFGEEGKFTAYVLALLLFITLPLMLISSPVAIVIGAMVGVVLAVLLNLYDASGLIGTASTALWFFIAAAIILWRIAKRDGA